MSSSSSSSSAQTVLILREEFEFESEEEEEEEGELLQEVQKFRCRGLPEGEEETEGVAYLDNAEMF